MENLSRELLIGTLRQGNTGAEILQILDAIVPDSVEVEDREERVRQGSRQTDRPPDPR